LIAGEKKISSNSDKKSLDATLLLVDTVKSRPRYLVGVRIDIKEHLPESGGAIAFNWQAHDDARDCDLNERSPSEHEGGQILPESNKSLLGSFTSTENVFTNGDITEITVLGYIEHWLVNPKDVILDTDTILGSGGFGVVYPGFLYGGVVAVKMPRDCSLRNFTSCANELRILRNVRHPNIVLFHGACLAEKKISLICSS
jgi:hypothetical protein